MVGPMLLPRVRVARAEAGAGRRMGLPLLLATAGALAVAVRLLRAPEAGVPPSAAQASTAFAVAPSTPLAARAAPSSSSESALAVPSSDRPLLSRRNPDESKVTMYGGARRQTRINKPKKRHIRDHDRYVQKKMWSVEIRFMKLTWLPEHNLEMWSQTLKLSFPEGEDDVVTEAEVMEYFTTEDYKPEAVIVGHQLPHEEVKHTYVHFGTNEEAIKARKEKNGGSIGKASEVKIVYTDEKKWVRLRDGVSLVGAQRARWMKPYGWKAYPGHSHEWAEDTAARNHPVYPVD